MKLNKNKYKLWLLAIAAILSLAVIAGCGDSGGSDGGAGAAGAASGTDDGEGAGTGTDAGSEAGGEGEAGDAQEGAKAEFVAEANEICVERRTEVLARVDSYVEKRLNSGKSAAELQAEAVDPIFVPFVETQVREIRELDAPPGEEEQVETFLAAMEAGAAKTKSKNYTASNVERLGSEYGQADKLAKQLGLDSCSFSV